MLPYQTSFPCNRRLLANKFFHFLRNLRHSYATKENFPYLRKSFRYEKASIIAPLAEKASGLSIRIGQVPMRLPFYTVTQSVSQSNSPQHSSPAFFLILGMFLLPTPLRSFCQSRYSSDCPSFVQYSIFLEGSIHKLTHPSHSFTHSYVYTSLFNSKRLLQKH